MERVLLPLKAITDAFPAELQPLVARAPGSSVMVALPVERLVSQLATGKVEVTFGELRKVAPMTIFSTDPAQDGTLVPLPLKEVVSRIDPSLLRHQGQRRTELPADIGGVFARQGEAIPAPEAAQVAPPEPPPTPVVPEPTPRPPAGGDAPLAFRLSQETPDVAPPPAVEPSPQDEEAPALSLKEESLPENAPLSVSSELKALFANATPEPTPEPPAPEPARHEEGMPILKLSSEPKPAPPVQPPPAPEPIEEEESAPIVPLLIPKPAAKAPAAAPIEPIAMPEREATPPPEVAGALLSLPLEKISEVWPEAIREEIASAPHGSTLELPVEEIGEALKRGKITLPWARLRAAITPPLATPCDALYAEAMLELPLRVVAPLFMAVAPTSSSRRVTVDEAIPAPFATAATRRAEAAALAPQETTGAPDAIAATGGGTLGFDGRLPKELVERACALNGVAGAVIALKEGLLVAAQLPPEFEKETFGAFLPQLFNRVEQTMESLQIGPLQNLMFTAGERPWQIWKAGENVFFAAMGRPGELLPGAQLKLIAAQLARHTKG